MSIDNRKVCLLVMSHASSRKLLKVIGVMQCNIISKLLPLKDT